MATFERFGPNRAAIELFLAELPRMHWFASVGQPPDDERAEYVDFHFLARHYENPYGPWGDALLSAEGAIERLELDHGRLGSRDAVQQAYAEVTRGPLPGLDEFYVRMDEIFANPDTGYYRDLEMYPHELIDFPDRLVRGVALELMVLDLDPQLRFYQGIWAWFRQGRWPAGWMGTWPAGKVLLW